ncbi:hypothetical protein [Shinella sp.]|uniref:hypothetical protein n=1 Tax=Shinella sp. TaxID=1870904 RepID=UPI00403692C6
MVNIEAGKILDEIDKDSFIQNARRMIFSNSAAQIFIDNLRTFTIDPTNMRSAILVFWSLPYYVLLYEARCIENGADPQKYRDIVVAVNNAVDGKIKFIAESFA